MWWSRSTIESPKECRRRNQSNAGSPPVETLINRDILRTAAQQRNREGAHVSTGRSYTNTSNNRAVREGAAKNENTCPDPIDCDGQAGKAVREEGHPFSIQHDSGTGETPWTHIFAAATINVFVGNWFLIISFAPSQLS